ncbi:MAG: 2-succinyl-5-enolpyruvyl-6-hydroxy-3-cyclohexene-1-carboxylic-acid synthase, partial [Candidatus Binatia bacterium]
MSTQAPNLNSLWGSLLIEEFVRNGISYFCLPSGSRCAPLTTAVAAHPRATSMHHFDERGAAFHTLGYGRATGRPAVLIITSGTAVANTWPAVVEASMDRVPMILVTADRPPELQDTGANQAIDQVKFFGPYVRWQIGLPCPDPEINPEVILTGIDQAVYRAQRVPQGPVHINCMFREPLAPIHCGEDYARYLSGLATWRNRERPYTEYSLPTSTKVEALHQLACTLNEVERGLVVVGSLRDSVQRESVRKLAQKLAWPTLPDITSGLRLGSPHSPMIPYYDAMLASSRFTHVNQPQAVLHLGGRLISKRLLDYLERCQPSPYILVDDHPFRHDPLHGVSLRIETEINCFCESLSPCLRTREISPWLSRWRGASDRVGQTLEDFTMESGSLSEPLGARLVSQLIRPDHGLFL